MSRLLLSAMSVALTLLSTAPHASAQAKFPNRQIRLIVPFAAGGGVDVVARLVGQRMSETMGQPIVVESKPGAGGALAANEVMRAEPDGYTLLITTSSHATLPTIAKLPWHPSNDFAPIATVYSTMFVMPTNSANASQYRSFKEFIGFARTNPGKVSWGSSGIAGPQHLAGAHFAGVAGIDMVHIPYRGNAPMVQALLANDVQLVFDTPTLVLPQIQDGKLIPLAVTGDQRLPKLPDVPTVREAGIDFSYEARIFVLGTKGMPLPVQEMLNKELLAAIETPAVRDRLIGLGLSVLPSRDNSIADLKKYIDGFADTYGKLITKLDIKAQ